MTWFKDQRIPALEEEVRQLRRAVEELRRACTMRVGSLPNFHNPYRSDPRPILTAMDAVQKLMADAGIEPKEVTATNARVEFVQKEAPKW